MKKPAQKSLKKEYATLFTKLEYFFTRYSKFIPWAGMVIMLVFSWFLFNPNVSTGGDDSGYIMAANSFKNGEAYPGWHGPFYSILLSFFLRIFGIKVVALKIISNLFMVGSLYFIYKVFIRLTNTTITACVVLCTASSYLLLSYAGTTYTEPFFFFLQSVLLFMFTNYLNQSNNLLETWKNSWKYPLLLATIAYIAFQTRSVAIGAIVAIIIAFLFEKKFKSLLFFIGSTLLVHLLNSVYKKLVWNAKATGFEEQLDSFLLINSYKPEEGNENLLGLIQRFWDNCELYLSKHFAIMTGFVPVNSLETNTFVAILVASLIMGVLVYSFLRNRKFFYVFLSISGMIATTFLFIQKFWDQERLIVIFFPFMIGGFALLLYKLFETQKFVRFQIIPVAILVVFSGAIVLQTWQQIEKSNIRHHFSGDLFESYSPDWQNYLLACQWAGDNLPDTAVVVCRKPEMAWIASEGKNIFTGLYRLDTDNADSMETILRNMSADYIIAANLRLNPSLKTDRIINTIHNALMLFSYRRPSGVRLVKEFGQDEKTYILKIDWREMMPVNEYYSNLQDLLKVVPQNIEITDKLASKLVQEKKYTEALTFLLNAKKYNNDEPKLLMQIAVCYFNLEDYLNAIATFKELCQKDPGNADAWYNLSVSYFRAEDFKGSREALKRAKELEVDPMMVTILERALENKP